MRTLCLFRQATEEQRRQAKEEQRMDKQKKERERERGLRKQCVKLGERLDVFITLRWTTYHSQQERPNDYCCSVYTLAETIHAYVLRKSINGEIMLII